MLTPSPAHPEIPPTAKPVGPPAAQPAAPLVEVTVIIRTIGRASLQRALHSVDAQASGSLQPLVVLVQANPARPLPEVSCSSPLLQVGGPHLRSENKPESKPDSAPGHKTGHNTGHAADSTSDHTPQHLMGRAQAAQLGLSHTRTEFALFLDDDDELRDGHLQRLVQALQQAPGAVLAHAGVQQLSHDPQGQVQLHATFDQAFEPWELLVANRLPIHAALFRWPVLKAAGVAFDQSFEVYEDWDFWLQAQAVGRFVHLPGVSATYWIDASASEAQHLQHGDPAYWALWRKWWVRAPREWWAALFQAGRDAPTLLRGQAGTIEHLRQHNSLLAEQQRQTDDNRAGWQQLAEGLKSDLERSQTAHQQLQQGYLKAQEAWAHSHQQLQGAINALQTQQQQLQDRADDLGRQLQAAQSHSASLQHDLSAIQRSTSWRLTQPLRHFVGALRRWKARLAPSNLRTLPLRSFPRPALLAAVMPDPYQAWIKQHEPDAACPPEVAARINALQPGSPVQAPLISVVMPVYNPPAVFLDEAIASLQRQWYPHWELCIADDCSSLPGTAAQLRSWAEREPRIRLVLRTQNGHISACSNSALELAQGEWVALLDQDDLLAPNALWEVVQAAQQHPDAGLIYTDEDKVDEQGRRFGPYFKPAFNARLLLGQNLISHLGVYRRRLLQAVGGFRLGFEGSQDHDLALRCLQRLQRHQVVHLPRVLYHWRVHAQSTSSGSDAKPYALTAGCKAVQEHVRHTDPGATADIIPGLPHYRVRHSLPAQRPTLALVVVDASGRAVPQDLLPAALLAALGAPPVVALHSEAPHWLETCRRSLADLVLVLQFAPHEAQPQAVEGLDDWMAQALQPGTGVVGAAMVDEQARLGSIGLLMGLDAAGLAWARPLQPGLPQGHAGHFAQAALARGVSAVSPAAFMLRPAVLRSLGFVGEGFDTPAAAALSVALACINKGLDNVFTPMASLRWSHNPEAAALRSLTLKDRLQLATLWADVLRQPDLGYSPNLCAEHGDYRIAARSASQSPRALQAASAAAPTAAAQ